MSGQDNRAAEPAQGVPRRAISVGMLAVGLILMLYGWAFAFVQYYGLSFLVIGSLLAPAAAVLSPRRSVFVTSIIVLAVGWSPLLPVLV